MKHMLFLFCFISNAFCVIGSSEDDYQQKKLNSSNNKAVKKLVNFGLEGSYLYWMIGNYSTYAAVYSTKEFRPYSYSGPDSKHDYIGAIVSRHIENITDNAVSTSGVAARISLFSQHLQGWEFGLKGQWIKHTDDALGCSRRLFTDGGWYGLRDEHDAKDLPLPKTHNDLAAIFNIGREGDVYFYGSSHDNYAAGFQLDKAVQSFDFKSFEFDFTNLGLLFHSNYIRYAFGFGIEIDFFKNAIEVRGGKTLFWSDPGDVMSAKNVHFFAYKLENNPFAVGPFFKFNVAFQLNRKKHVFLLEALLYGAGLYTQFDYKEYYEVTDYYDNIQHKFNPDTSSTTLAPAYMFPTSGCHLKFGAPDYCYKPRAAMYHAKVALGPKYTLNLDDIDFHAGLTWEINCFLNFFDKEFIIYSHDSLNYQGLTATFGVSF